MNCNCISDTEKKLADLYRKDAGDTATATCKGTAVDLYGGKVDLVIPFRIKGDKRPYHTANGKEVIFVASFCPFCGKSTKKEASNVSTGTDQGSAEAPAGPSGVVS